MKRIGLFCGGFSSEHAISILSANTIISNFPKEFEVVKIIVSKEDKQYIEESRNTLKKLKASEVEPMALQIFENFLKKL